MSGQVSWEKIGLIRVIKSDFQCNLLSTPYICYDIWIKIKADKVDQNTNCAFSPSANSKSTNFIRMARP